MAEALERVALKLWDALGYMVDVYACGGASVFKDPDEAPYWQAKAFEKAIAALGAASFVLVVPPADGRIERQRRETLANERTLPVKDGLRDELMQIRTRIAKALDLFTGETWERMPYERRQRNAAALMKLARLLVGLAEQIAEPLPSTTACICRQCGTVVLPADGPAGYYEHCGRSWRHHRELNQRPLPAGFWETYKPGDRYAKYKDLEPPVDHKGRPDVLTGGFAS